MNYTNFDIEKYKELENKILKLLDLNHKVPKDINISTMTIEAKLNVSFFSKNIFYYINKNPYGIINIIESKNKKKIIIKKKKNDIFLNQITLSIYVNSKKKPISVKLFNNGSLHFTGCISITNIIESVNILCHECKKTRAIISNNKIEEIYFVNDIQNLSIEKLYNFKIDMINCNFVVPFKIDRPILFNLLKSNNHNVEYDSNGHAGVKIKYESFKSKITIFIFESGSVIIIFGNQGFKNITKIYTFVWKYLLNNYTLIVKNNNLMNTIINNYL